MGILFFYFDSIMFPRLFTVLVPSRYCVLVSTHLKTWKSLLIFTQQCQQENPFSSQPIQILQVGLLTEAYMISVDGFFKQTGLLLGLVDSQAWPLGPQMQALNLWSLGWMDLCPRFVGRNLETVCVQEWAHIHRFRARVYRDIPTPWVHWTRPRTCAH